MSAVISFSPNSELQTPNFSFPSIAILTIPVADAYCSRHPLLPQGQGGPSGYIVICPNSPAIPYSPRHIFLLRTIPPPTPVPRVSIQKLSKPFPPPIHPSPIAARFASLSIKNGIFNSFSSL